METKARYALIGLFTLAVISAGFGFVYWLQNTGGMGQRTEYRIRFENPVSGLLIGSNVLFNGIRVGEVTSLQLNPNQPRLVLAAVAVDPATPIRSDTAVDMDFQGLTGAPVIALTGGSPTAAALASPDGQPPLLVAAANAGRSLTQSARETLGRLDTILADNATPLHDAVTNFSTFTQVLGRNSDRIDGILAGLERMTGGAAGQPRVPIYSLTAATDLPPCPEAVDRQLVVPEPASLLGLSTNKIPVKGTPADPRAFDNGQLADTVPALIQATVIESLENSRCIRSVTRPIDGLQADLQLVLDIRSFAILADGDPKADIDVSAKVVSTDGKNLGSLVIREKAALNTIDPAGAVAALDQAFAKMIKELVPWVAGVSASAPQATAEPAAP
jgi:phospholipid/cholesterol/gamma-HCH transport system substrate-binding protein